MGPRWREPRGLLAEQPPAPAAVVRAVAEPALGERRDELGRSDEEQDCHAGRRPALNPGRFIRALAELSGELSFEKSSMMPIRKDVAPKISTPQTYRCSPKMASPKAGLELAERVG